MDFDEIIDLRGTHSSKWDEMEKFSGVSPDDGLSMWVAATDFKTAPNILSFLQQKVDQGVFGYFGDKSDYLAATRWWMKNRHGWQISEDWIVPISGLGTALAMTIEVYTNPGDSVVIFSPVYNEFASKITNAGRQVLECPLVNHDGQYTLDFDAYDKMMTGREKLVFWCSPQNPSGRVWTQPEHQAMADFAKRHDLVVVSDEVHHDLVYPGFHHIPTAMAVPEISDRLITLAAASKTFNIAGLRTGNVIVENEKLRSKLTRRLLSLYIQPCSLGLEMTTVAYSEEGSEWLDAQIKYLDGNRKLFDAGINAIPGIRSMPLQATYLAWVDFSGTGMKPDEVARRIAKDARIAVSPGKIFGAGGDEFMRFNIGMPRSQIQKAVERMQAAFADMQ